VNILDLDGAQGLTPEMVRRAAESAGFTYRDTALYYPDGTVAMFFATNPHSFGAAIAKVAGHSGRSAQDILRDINPRMRKGVPSEAARNAHRGNWMARHDAGTIIVGTWINDSEFGLALDCHGTRLDISFNYRDRWSFWPCDAAGNKCRWPTDASGNLL